jgi:hypothetical protein
MQVSTRTHMRAGTARAHSALALFPNATPQPARRVYAPHSTHTHCTTRCEKTSAAPASQGCADTASNSQGCNGAMPSPGPS